MSPYNDLSSKGKKQLATAVELSAVAYNRDRQGKIGSPDEVGLEKAFGGPV